MLIEYFGFSDDEKPKQLPTKFTLIVENLRNNVLVKMKHTQKEDIVKWVTCFIYEMINATSIKDGSWPGDIHAFVLSKMLKIRIVIVNNYWMGLEEGWFDTDKAFFDDIISGLSDTISSQAPTDQKTCYLYRVNSKFSPYTCDWTNAMNHFEYLWKTSEDVLTDDDKQHAYKGRGGIDMRCHPFDLRELWEDLVKRLVSSSEDSNQASSLLLTKKSTHKEISKDTLILLLQKMISVQFKHAHGIKPT